MNENHAEHCCGHHHEHAPKQSKYEVALSKYDLNISDGEVREAVKKIIAEKVHENDTPEVKKFLMGSIVHSGEQKITFILSTSLTYQKV